MLTGRARENPFLYNPRFVTPKPSNTTDSRSQGPYLKQDSVPVDHIFEIFHFQIIIEKSSKVITVTNDFSKSPGKPQLTHSRTNFRLASDKLDILPIQTVTSIQLPLVTVNLSISALYILLSIGKIWTSSSQGMQLSNIGKSSHPYNEKHASVPGSHSESLLGEQRRPNTQFRRKRPISRGLTYVGSNIRQILETTLLSDTTLSLEGLIINLGMRSKVPVTSFRDSQNNSFLMIILQGLTLSSQVQFFESPLKVEIKDLLIQDCGICSDSHINLSDAASQAYSELKKGYNHVLDHEEKKSARKQDFALELHQKQQVKARC